MTIDNILSLGAIAISVGSFIWQDIRNKKYHDADLEADYYKEIYWKYLISELPTARNRITYNDGRVSSTNDIEDVLNKIRQDSVFFKFKDKKYYQNIIKKLQDLEDIYVEVDELDHDGFADFQNDTEKRITEIYKIITDKYLGR